MRSAFMLCTLLVEVDVNVRLAVVSVAVDVNIRPLAQYADYREDSETNDHQRHCELES